MPTLVALTATPRSIDHRLVRDIEAATVARRGPAFRGIDITADGGIVTVQGWLRSFYEKQLLIHTIRRVPGVQGIIDEVQVQPSTTP